MFCVSRVKWVHNEEKNSRGLDASNPFWNQYNIGLNVCVCMWMCACASSPILLHKYMQHMQYMQPQNHHNSSSLRLFLILSSVQVWPPRISPTPFRNESYIGDAVVCLQSNLAIRPSLEVALLDPKVVDFKHKFQVITCTFYHLHFIHQL